MNQTFILTKEHRRFTEFANAVRAERTIGICHGDAGVGKTNSARRYANWDTLEPYLATWGPRSYDDIKHYTLANRARTVFYTPEVVPRHRELIRDIDNWVIRLGVCVDEHQRAVGKVTDTRVGDATRWVELLIVDEAERLTPPPWKCCATGTTAPASPSSSSVCPASTNDSATTRSSTADSASPTATEPSAATNSCSSSTATGNDSAAA